MFSKIASRAALAALPFLIAAMPVQAENANDGKALYDQNCIGCHKDVAKFAGKSSEELLGKLQKYQAMTTFETEKQEKMHKAVAPLNAKDLETLAAYMAAADKK